MLIRRELTGAKNLHLSNWIHLTQYITIIRYLVYGLVDSMISAWKGNFELRNAFLIWLIFPVTFLLDLLQLIHLLTIPKMTIVSSKFLPAIYLLRNIHGTHPCKFKFLMNNFLKLLLCLVALLCLWTFCLEI